jgi:hypothetical protein
MIEAFMTLVKILKVVRRGFVWFQATAIIAAVAWTISHLLPACPTLRTDLLTSRAAMAQMFGAQSR